MLFSPEIPVERAHTQTSVCVHTLSCEGFVNATGWMVKTDHYKEEEGREGITWDEVSTKVRKVIKKEVLGKVIRG